MLLICLSFTAAFTITTHGQQSQIAASNETLSGGCRKKLDRIFEVLNESCSSRSSDISGLGSTLTSYLLEELRSSQSRLQRMEQEFNSKLQVFWSSVLNETKAQLLERNLGSTYIRWGRKNCPINSTLVYTGIAGGKQYNIKGGGGNRLCLTNTPQFDNAAYTAVTATLYGSEYEQIGSHHDHDVPCCVCLTPQASTIMIPSTLTCPPGWTPQYAGLLAAAHDDHFSTEYVCLDRDLEDYNSGARDDNGLLFYLVGTRCGSLPCPPYVNNQIVTCVVCSK